MQILIGCAVLAVLSFAYSLPILPLKNKRRLKDFGWVKILVLTLVWTIVTSVLPMLYWDVSLSAYPFEILIRFVFLFTLCVAFDIRDMQTDLEAGIATLPNLIGVKNSYRLMDVALVLFVLLSIIQYIRYPIAGRLAGEVITALATKLVINHSKTHSSDRVYLGLVDGMMLLYGLLMLLH
jgi:1,4-dihydroxy-2-naphthoate octaprenyltransferase